MKNLNKIKIQVKIMIRLNLKYLKILNKKTDVMIEVSGNTLNRLFQSKSMQPYYIGFYNFKGTLSSLRQFSATKSLLKMIRNAFYFTLKALFFLKIF